MTSGPASPTPPFRVVNALSFDVEDYFQVQAFAGSIPRSRWGSFSPRVEANTGRILDLLAERQVRATFFILGWVARHHPEVVRQVIAAGHEVASHGMYHTLVYTQTPATFREETRACRSLLEDVVQAPITGYRAATFSVTAASLWALDILAEEGFGYDSSVFPVHHDRYGMPHTPRFPYTVTLDRGLRVIEFPLSTIEVLGVRFPVAGGGYFRLLPFFLTKLALARINRRDGRPFVFYLHPWEIDPEQPRIRTANPLGSVRHRLCLRRTEPRLRALLGQFAFAPIKEVLAANPPAESLSLPAMAGQGRG